MNDIINLTIPAKPDYFLTARLAASSVASRMGFDVNDIEDIKTALAEALLIIIHQKKSQSIDISFSNKAEGLDIVLQSVFGEPPAAEIENEESSLSRYLIEALADSSEFEEEDEMIKSITLTKNLQR